MRQSVGVELVIANIPNMPTAAAVAFAKLSPQHRDLVAAFGNSEAVTCVTETKPSRLGVWCAPKLPRNDKFRRERASNPHASSRELAGAALGETGVVRYAAWCNPNTPTNSVLAALAQPEASDMWSDKAMAHSAQAARASAITFAHPEAIRSLGYGIDPVRNGASAFADFSDPANRKVLNHILTTSTVRSVYFNMNPTVPASELKRDRKARRELDDYLHHMPLRDIKQGLLTGKEAEEALTFDVPIIDAAVAVHHPLLVATDHNTSNRHMYLPVVIARAAQQSALGAVVIPKGHGQTRVKLAEAYSPRLQALRGVRLDPDSAKVNLRFANRNITKAARILGEDPAAWMLWSKMVGNLTLRNHAQAPRVATAALAAVAA